MREHRGRVRLRHVGQPRVARVVVEHRVAAVAVHRPALDCAVLREERRVVEGVGSVQRDPVRLLRRNELAPRVRQALLLPSLAGD